MQLMQGNKPITLPDFFIVGAAKSATTSLYALLKQHPGIFLPPRKELYTFAYDGKTPVFTLENGTTRPPVGCTWDEYYSMYNKCPDTSIAGDTSSWYLYYYKEVIPALRKMYGNRASEIKIIIVLRHPVDRAWSHYTMHYGQGTISLPFSEAIKQGTFREKVTAPGSSIYPGYDYIGFGLYGRQVEAFLDAFPNTYIVSFGDFCKDNKKTVDGILRFLGLEPVEHMKSEKQLNVSGEPKSRLAHWVTGFIYRPNKLKALFRRLVPLSIRDRLKSEASRFLFKKLKLSETDRELLKEIYRDDIQYLENVLKYHGIPFSF